MKIRHEAPDSNMDWTVTAPLVVETPSGASVCIKSWSLSGLVWPDDAPDCPTAGTLSVPFQGVDIRFPVRLSKNEQSGLVSLEGLSGRQRETLALFYRSLLSGKMASSGDVITSLDTPVDLVPMEQTEAEQSEQPVKFVPQPVRVLFNVLTYLSIAALVVGIIGNNIFTNLDRIDIQHGRVLAPMSHSFPSQGGFVHSVDVSSGQKVRTGDVMIRLHDPEVQARLDQAEAELAVARQEHARAIAAMEELAEHQQSENTAMRMAVAARFYTEFVGKGGFDDMRRQWVSMRGRNDDLAAVSDPVTIVSDLMAREVARRAARSDSARADRDGLRDLIDRNHIRAPSDGVVREVMVRPGQLFGTQEGDLVFERAEPRATVGWVSEKFAETLYIGMPATIGLNENGQKITFDGAITDVRAGDHPERPGEFGIMVTVSATNLSAEATKARLRLGAPVNLEAKRQLGQAFRGWLAKMGVRNG
ncbi:hypothetical protein GCM10007385_31100 [Tateyamaria omphalii]|uniref:HlyD family secretion protein n=1 Tax=Tateyamaria omphalii TaxID=299262 RepID=UPI00167B08E1|nr:biotin/lipoyl-binding protein [Tateyamaria omphalii]GGX59665.1 hypothetical protein GCM10007385_31100 [Tateyamaria omphalii]